MKNKNITLANGEKRSNVSGFIVSKDELINHTGRKYGYRNRKVSNCYNIR